MQGLSLPDGQSLLICVFSPQELGKKDRTLFSRLTTLLSDDDNKAALRAHLEGISSECIPFLGMYLTDLLFIDTILKSRRNGTPHLSKDDVIAQVTAFQSQSSYDHLKENEVVMQYIQASQFLDEMQMFEEDAHYK